MQAFDRFDDSTKAFGVFRFELYAYRAHEPDPRGRRIHVWRADLSDPQVNLAHWDTISRTYQFRLVWKEPVPVGEKFVLAAILDGPRGRLFDQRVFTSGE